MLNERRFLLKGACLSALYAGVAATICCDLVRADDVAINHEVKLQYDLGGARVPEWSGGALVDFISNQTAAPEILTFDEHGRQLPSVVFTIPESELIDLDDVARGADGTLAVCGSAYDHSGRGSSFLAVISAAGEKINVIRLYPYSARRLTIASDGSIWTAGLEMKKGRDVTPPDAGVVRHYDQSGQFIGSFVARSSLSSGFMVKYSRFQAARDRIGWYTGPMFGPGSQYYEIQSNGTVRRYPDINLDKSEGVTGLGLTSDGRTYVTTNNNTTNVWRLLSIGGPNEGWVQGSLGDGLHRLMLYGADGNRLVFYHQDRLTVAFATAAQ